LLFGYVFVFGGGYAVSNATLNRFFSLHFVLPFFIVFISSYTFFFFASCGSSSALGLLVIWDNVFIFFVSLSYN
jgi:quinol-cytochrome oxidoreductase complex cytochrome b subunit